MNRRRKAVENAAKRQRLAAIEGELERLIDDLKCEVEHLHKALDRAGVKVNGDA